MRAIRALVRAGTLAAAGAALGVNYTTVARRVQRAEAALGHPVFERHPDRYVPLPEARDIAETTARMEVEEHDLMRRLAGRDQALSGRLVFTAPGLLIQAHLAPLLARFTEQYPDIDLVVKASYGLLDLTRREADLAVRISAAPHETLVGRRLTEQRCGYFAVPEVACRAADVPEAPVDWLLYEAQAEVRAPLRQIHPNLRVRARFDDMGALIAAAQCGMGVLRLPLFLGASTPGLVELPHLPREGYAPIWLLHHADLQTAAKVSALKEVLAPWFLQHRAAFTGMGPQTPG